MESRLHMIVNMILFHSDLINTSASPYQIIFFFLPITIYAFYFNLLIGQPSFASFNMMFNIFCLIFFSTYYQFYTYGLIAGVYDPSDVVCSLKWLVIVDYLYAYIKADIPTHNISANNLTLMGIIMLALHIYVYIDLSILVKFILGVLITFFTTIGARIMHHFIV